MVCGFGDSVSYVNLVKKVTGRDLDKSSRFTDWSRRPLSQRQLVYALGDVTHLRDIYRCLKAELDATGRAAWLTEEMATLTDPKTYESHPESAWKRLKLRVKNRKALAVLMEPQLGANGWRRRRTYPRPHPARRGPVRHRQPGADDARGAGRMRSLSDGFSRSARARRSSRRSSAVWRAT